MWAHSYAPFCRFTCEYLETVRFLWESHTLNFFSVSHCFLRHLKDFLGFLVTHSWVLAEGAMGKDLILSLSETVTQRAPQFYLVLIWWESIASFKPTCPWFSELSKCSFIPACKQANLLFCLLSETTSLLHYLFRKKKYSIETNSCYKQSLFLFHFIPPKIISSLGVCSTLYHKQ